MSGESHWTWPESASPIEPRIYVASLSDYNAGRLHGVWLDANAGVDVLEEGVAALLAASREPGAEEFAIHDYEHFGPLRLGEYEPLDLIATLGQGIAQHGPAFAAWAASLDSPSIADLDGFQDAFHGDWDSRTAYTDQLLDEFGVDLDEIESVPELLRRYLQLDMQGWLRDCELGGEIEIVEHPGGIWVFTP